jgi:hypothetical protein
MLTNDVLQGREHAKHVPLSDQWDDHIPKVKTPKKWRPEYFHRKNVMNDFNGRGVETFVIEDVFHSFETRPDRPNPHNSRMEQGKFFFDYPASWTNANTVNRSVSLRSIAMSPRSYFFRTTWTLDKGAGGVAFVVPTTIPPNFDIESAMSTLAKQVNDSVIRSNYGQVQYSYDATTQTAGLSFYKTPTIAAWQLHLDAADPQFFELFNVNEIRRPIYTDPLLFNTWSFPNVWDRRSLFFHASFVTNAAFHYLGRAGDFYTTLSKIYQAQFGPDSFEIHVSQDGINPIDIGYESFTVELAFIIDSKNYLD